MLDFINNALEQKQFPNLCNFTWFAIIWTLLVVLGILVFGIAAASSNDYSGTEAFTVCLSIILVFCVPVWIVQYIWQSKMKYYAVPDFYPPGAGPSAPYDGMIDRNAVMFALKQRSSFGLKAFTMITILWSIIMGLAFIAYGIDTVTKGKESAGVMIISWFLLMAIMTGPLWVPQYIWVSRWKQKLLRMRIQGEGYGPQFHHGFPAYQTSYPLPPGYGPPPWQYPHQGYPPPQYEYGHQYAGGSFQYPPPPQAPQRSAPFQHDWTEREPPVNRQKIRDDERWDWDEHPTDETETWDDVNTAHQEDWNEGEGVPDEGESFVEDSEQPLIQKAREYEHQGKYLNAIRIYEKLDMWDEVDRLITQDIRARETRVRRGRSG